MVSIPVRQQKLRHGLLLWWMLFCSGWLWQHCQAATATATATAPATGTTTTTTTTDRHYPYGNDERTFVSFGRVAFRPGGDLFSLRKRRTTRSSGSGTTTPLDSSSATAAPPVTRPYLEEEEKASSSSSSSSTKTTTTTCSEEGQPESHTRRKFLRGILAVPFLSKKDQQRQPTRQEMQVDAYTYKQQQQQQQQQDESTAATDDMELRLLQGLTQPLIPMSIWEAAKGDEFIKHPDRVNDLVKSGAMLAEQDESNEWINWKAAARSSSNDDDEDDDDNILVWTGRVCKTDKDNYYGSQVPLVKTRSVIPLSVKDMVSLLMDSERVKTYNAWSLGREDCWVLDNNSSSSNNNNKVTSANAAAAADEQQQQQHITKIVKNRTQPPIVGSKPMVSVTLLHARPWKDDGSWLVVSRAVGGTQFMTSADQKALSSGGGRRSDILMGVNLLRPVSATSCQLTAVTHMYSKAVPGMLAERLGVKSAVKFVKDMRRLAPSLEDQQAAVVPAQ